MYPRTHHPHKNLERLECLLSSPLTEGRPADLEDLQACSGSSGCTGRRSWSYQEALAVAAKRKVKNQENSQRLLQVQDLQKQGEMLHATTSDTAAVWAKAVQALPSNIMKFAHMIPSQLTPMEGEGQCCLPFVWRKAEPLACAEQLQSG